MLLDLPISISLNSYSSLAATREHDTAIVKMCTTKHIRCYHDLSVEYDLPLLLCICSCQLGQSLRVTTHKTSRGSQRYNISSQVDVQ